MKHPIEIAHVKVFIQPDAGPQSLPALVLEFPTGRSVSVPLSVSQRERIGKLTKAANRHVEALLEQHKSD